MARRSIERGADARSSPVHGGAGDLGLYGAVPMAFVLDHATAANASGTIASRPVDADRAAAPSHATVEARDHGGAAVSFTAAQHLTSSAGSGHFTVAADHPQNASGAAAAGKGHTHIAAASPAAQGSGSLFVVQPVPHAFDPASPVAAILHDGVAAPVGPADLSDAMASIHASAGALQSAIATLAQQVGATAAQEQQGVHDALSQVQETVDGIIGQVPDVHQLLSDATAHASDTVDHLIATTGDTAAALTAQAGQTVDHVVGAATDAAATLTAHAAQAVDHGTAGIGDTVDGITGSVTQQVSSLSSHVADSAHDLVGADPSAGIATLVGMVSAADAFNLHDDAGHATALSPSLGALGVTDALADLHPAAVLPGLLDSHAHDLGHHDGLFGHG